MLGVSRAALYTRPKQPEKDKQLLAEILPAMRDHPHYGHRRIAIVLGKNRKLVLRIMRKYGLRVGRRRKQQKKHADVGNPPTGIPNRTKSICPIRPNVVWAGDFTYIVYYGTIVYLATVIDLYTREIIGWSIGLHHTAQLVIDALEAAVQFRGITPQIHHSDQGSEYASVACRAWFLAHHVLPSQSHKGHPWENGHQESFYNQFKKELGRVHEYGSLEELIIAIHHQIHYYNNRRIHGVLKMTPRQFHERYQRRMGKTVENLENEAGESV